MPDAQPPSPRHPSLDALLATIAEQLPPDDPDRSAQTLTRMTTPSERATPGGHDHELQEWRTAAYAHARRADDAEAVTRHTKELMQRRTARLRARAENAETDLALIQDAARLHQQNLINTDELYAVIETREPAPVVITQDAAAHILAQEDLDQGYQPGRYIGCLLTAWRQADPDHAARLAAAYPVYGAAIALLNAPGGIEQLRAIATGEDTCRVLVIDGQPIRVHGGKEPTDQGRAALAEVIAAARRKYAAEHPDDVEGA